MNLFSLLLELMERNGHLLSSSLAPLRQQSQDGRRVFWRYWSLLNGKPSTAVDRQDKVLPKRTRRGLTGVSWLLQILLPTQVTTKPMARNLHMVNKPYETQAAQTHPLGPHYHCSHQCSPEPHFALESCSQVPIAEVL